MQQLRRSQRASSSSGANTNSPRAPPTIHAPDSSRTPVQLHKTKSMSGSGRRIERDRMDRLTPRVTPLHRVPSKRTAARIGGGIRSAVPALGPDRGRTSRSSAPAKLFRSQTPPPRFATAGDTFSPENRVPLGPTHRSPRHVAQTKASDPQLISAASPGPMLVQSPSTLSDRWASTSGDELSSEGDSDNVSPLKRSAIQHRTHHRQESSSDDPHTPTI